MTAEDRFHKHLDECEQCRTQVFDLCPIGAAYIMRAVVAMKICNLDTIKKVGVIMQKEGAQ